MQEMETPNVVARGYGGLLPLLLVLGWQGTIKWISACQGTTASI
jgi:hypothetical protein